MPSPITWNEYWRGVKPHYERLWNCIRHPWRRGWKDRRGIVDLQHAYVNVDVESARLDPYKYGHLVAWARVCYVAILVWVLI